VLKVALLGFGFIGKAHGEAYAQIPNAQLVAVGGCREERVNGWRAPNHLKFYSDPDELLESSGADVVDICLPTFLHEEFVVKAAERGMHIICEKPLALTVAEVDRMLAAVRKAGVTFVVAQVLRFFAHYTKCRELVQQGRLGDIFFASASRLAAPPRWAEWFRDPRKSGGALFDLQVHDLDYLLNLFGMPERLFAVGRQSDSGCWDHVVSLLSHPDRTVSIESSYLMAPNRPFTSALRLMGTGGTLEYEFRVKGNVDVMDRAEHSLLLYSSGGPEARVAVADADPYLQELKYFVDTVERGGKPDAVPPEEVRNVIAVLEAVQQSLVSGQVVSLEHLEAHTQPSSERRI
jgi:predicted dehydrogenase